MYSDLIFENYESFLKEHKDDISTPMGAIEMMSSDGAFRAYLAALTEGLTPTAKSVATAICEREREMILEDSSNLGPSASAIGYAVTHFPILVDIYSDPIISEVATVYPTNKPMLTIPRVRINGSVVNTDGTTTNFRLPRSTVLGRQKTETLSLLPNVSNNLFTLPSTPVKSDEMRVNKRYFTVSKIKVKDNATPTAHHHEIALTLRPDARGQITKEFSFVDANNSNAVVNGKIVGNVDFNRGLLQYGCTFSSVVSNTAVYSAESVDCNVIFSAITSDVGRVKVKLENDGWDTYIDVRDDFELDLTTELLQDYND